MLLRVRRGFKDPPRAVHLHPRLSQFGWTISLFKGLTTVIVVARISILILVPTMKFSATALLLLTSSVSAKEQQPTECCLCGDDCAAVAPEKVDLITVSPFMQEGTYTTCEEIAMDLLDQHVNEAMCAKVRYDYQEACCSSGKSY